MGGGGGGTRSDIGPPKNSNIRPPPPPPPQKKSCVRKKSDIWLKKSDIRPRKKLLSDITPPKKNQISDINDKVPPFHPPPPPPLFVCLNVQIMVLHHLLRPLVCASLW